MCENRTRHKYRPRRSLETADALIARLAGRRDLAARNDSKSLARLPLEGGLRRRLLEQLGALLQRLRVHERGDRNRLAV
eukprot:6629320-Pyramimonas_sp.AAC.2